MRILIDNGTYGLDNLGDIAMLQAAAHALRAAWPAGQLSVVTGTPDELASHLSGARPQPVTHVGWRLRLTRLGNALPSRLSRQIQTLAEAAYAKLTPALDPWLAQALGETDLLVLAGSGLLADPFREPALRRLATIKAAHQQGVPVALVSQGVGPVTDLPLRKALARALSPARLIGLRERVHGPGLLQSLGVSPQQVVITGDDSLAVGYGARPERLGQGLGLNLRLAHYSGLGPADSPLLDGLRRALQQPIGDRPGALVPLAVDRQDGPALRSALARIPPSTFRPRHAHRVPELLAAISSCRLVVAGSYHAAVLALGQGIPALCLSRSDYYRYKFEGLADLFPDGCRLVDLAGADWEPRLSAELAMLWESADELREPLLRSAHEQIERSRNCYRLLRATLD